MQSSLIFLSLLHPVNLKTWGLNFFGLNAGKNISDQFTHKSKLNYFHGNLDQASTFNNLSLDLSLIHAWLIICSPLGALLACQEAYRKNYSSVVPKNGMYTVVVCFIGTSNINCSIDFISPQNKQTLGEKLSKFWQIKKGILYICIS